ncbi:amino acid permease [Catenulispora pinisilvae]|uniref:amino acid permease n=2 Tax=Catenulispora TaxID=414878 RepID=UPI00189181A4|nr:amino acid permease [Catenulispora pinisilvae]
MSMPSSASASPPRRSAAQHDEDLLRRIGVQPVLARRMTGFGNFAISFSIISILSGCMTLFGYGMGTGGPAVMIWGWIGVGALVLLVGLGLAEVTSAYPTAGALFFMAEKLGGTRGRAWSWVTGWLNLLGLLGAIAGIDYGAAQFTGALIALRSTFTPTKYSTLGIYAVILLLHALLNLFGVRVLDLFNRVSVIWHLAGVTLIAAVLVLVPKQHQSVSFVFTHYVNTTGFHSSLYVSAIGLLLAGYTFCGYDASAHLSEETEHAAVAAPRGIIRAIWMSWIAGAVLIAGMLYAVRYYADEAGAPVPPAAIFNDALGSSWAQALLAVVIIAQLCCGLAATGSASRMVFAFSRNGSMPGSGLWRRTNRHKVPVNAVWLAIIAAFVLALPSLWNPTAYNAVVAINIIGITPAYAIPIWLRVRAGSSFTPGEWSLGRFGRPIGIAAVSWVAIETVLFCLPQSQPMWSWTHFNYAPVALIAVLLLAAALWPRWGRGAGDATTAALEADKFSDIPVI